MRHLLTESKATSIIYPFDLYFQVGRSILRNSISPNNNKMKKLVVFFLVCFSCQVARSQWTTSGSNIYNSNTGNVGIGTNSPAQPLQVIGNIQGTRFIGYGAGGISSNTAVGALSLASNTTGIFNSAIGLQALQNNTTGFGNVATGTLALGLN